MNTLVEFTKMHIVNTRALMLAVPILLFSALIDCGVAQAQDCFRRKGHVTDRDAPV
jgi:hypothetical protein